MVYQFGAPLLDACVLAAMQEGDAYGYVLTKRVQRVMDISESTLYPVLRRLEKDNFLRTYDQMEAGRNRRYYSLTEQGNLRLKFYQNEWSEYKHKIDTLLIGGEENE